MAKPITIWWHLKIIALAIIIYIIALSITFWSLKGVIYVIHQWWRQS